MKTIIKNCKLVSPGIEAENVSIVIENDKIKTVHDGKECGTEKFDKVVDGTGLTAVPGFIDIHCHGSNGADVMDCTPDAIGKIAKAKIEDGVTSFCPTTLTASQSDLVKAAVAVKTYEKKQMYARSLGLHLEGPFVNPKFKGAQNPKYIRKPNINEVKEIDGITKVAIVSFAPEMEGGLDLVRELKKLNIVSSCAHSGATFTEFIAAKECGLKQLTHFCNQMSHLHHRELGLVGAGLLDDKIMVEIICDYIHLSANMLKLIFKNKTLDTIMLITDSMSATSLKDENYKLGKLDVVVKDSVARLSSNGAIAGSTLRYFVGLKNIHETTGLKLKDIIRTTSLNQAQSLGLQNLGKIERGYIADIVLLDKKFVPQNVFVSGKMVK